MITWTVLSLKWACLHRGKKSFNMGYPITTQCSWDDEDEASKFWRHRWSMTPSVMSCGLAMLLEFKHDKPGSLPWIMVLICPDGPDNLQVET